MFRSREVRRFAALFVLIAAATSALGFVIHLAAGVLALAAAAAFGAAFWGFTRARYQSLARLSEQIDLVLHSADRMSIEELDEGELSILQSEITKMTLRIREQNDALRREKERLADSLADIAHQLRTPLTSVNLILSLLESAQGEDERRALLRKTEELLMRMEWLISSLLKLSRLDAGIVALQSEPVGVARLIDAALRPFQIPMELHEIALRVDVPQEMEIRGDFNWLSEALQNILKNCIESAGERGRIEIVCQETPLFAEIAIRDSGPGFDQEELPCLFDRFYRGKESSAAGFGIGLALCKTIVTRQGGMVAAKNHPQGGAVFSVRFPK